MYVALILFLSLCLSQQTGKPSLTKNHNPDPSTKAQQKQADGTNDGIRSTYQISEQSKKTQQEKDEDAAEKRLYWRYLWATIIGAGVNALILIGIAIQNIYVRRSANAAKKSADALVKSQCAWIMVRLGWRPNMARIFNGKLLVNCVFTNQGQTPGWTTELRCEGGYVPEIPTHPNFEGIKIYEYEPRPFAAGEKTEPPRGLEFEVAQSSNDKYLIVYGVLKYRDMFGNDVRSTTFGYWVTPEPIDQAHLKRISLAAYNQNT